MNLIMKHAINRVWLLAFAVIIVILVINGALAYKALGDLNRNQRSVVNTLHTINSLADAYSALLNAEAGQRGFLLTGETKYLEPLENGLEGVESHLSALAAPLDALPTQRALLTELRAAVSNKIAELQRVVAVARQSEDAAIPFGLMSSQGKASMDRVRELVEQLKTAQASLLAEREMRANKSRREALATLITATLVSLFLIVLIYFLVRHSTSTREQLTQDLQRANEDLENKVKERTATLSHYANELGRSNRELQDFAFVASHDLQEPLRKIRAFGNRLQQKYSDTLGEQGVDYTNRMQAAAERMSRLINDLLAFSRVSTKGRPFQETALNEVLINVLDDLEVAIEESGATVEVDDLPVIEADPTQMHQLFQNLIGNALKFRQPDVAPHIRLTCTVSETSLIGEAEVENVCEIAIKDNGIGFDQQFMERIFTPFQRLHSRDQYAGTGIGLAVCRRIVERHEGFITAESTPGEGALFLLKLPIKQLIKPHHEIENHGG